MVGSHELADIRALLCRKNHVLFFCVFDFSSAPEASNQLEQDVAKAMLKAAEEKSISGAIKRWENPWENPWNAP